MNDQRFPHLAQLMGGYFHQDWDLEHGTLDEAVKAFMAGASQDEQDAVGHELVRALLSPEGLDSLLDELGADINPEPWGGPEGFLQAVRVSYLTHRSGPLYGGSAEATAR